MYYFLKPAFHCKGIFKTAAICPVLFYQYICFE